MVDKVESINNLVFDEPGYINLCKTSYKCHSDIDRGISKQELLTVVMKGANFAAQKHRKQKRKDLDGNPYINHPLGVANILIDEGKVDDPIVILAALLHDTVEDTETTFEEIEQIFGFNVRKVVEEVTDDKTLATAERKRLQVENAPKISDEAKLVKLADKLYNLRDILRNPPVEWTCTRIKEYFKWSKDVIAGCHTSDNNLERELDIVFEKYASQNIDSCHCLVPTCSMKKQNEVISVCDSNNDCKANVKDKQ